MIRKVLGNILIYNSIFRKQLDRRIIRKNYKSSRPEVLRKGVLKIWTKLTGTLLCNFIEVALRHGCSPVNLLHFFGTPSPRNTSEWLLLSFVNVFCLINKSFYDPFTVVFFLHESVRKLIKVLNDEWES